MKTNRIVFDTNVIVSALMFPRSAPRQAFNLAYSTGKILASTATILELESIEVSNVTLAIRSHLRHH